MDSLTQREVVDYDYVADEYYDAALHPTCANFERLSYQFVEERLTQSRRRFGRSLEVGAGKSVLARMREKGIDRIVSLTISDKSETMLRHSRDLARYYESAIILDVEDSNNSAARLGAQYDLVVASLADPYNGNALWSFLKTVVVASGWVILTTPSYEWCRRFRSEKQSSLFDVAEFVTRDGTRKLLPSIVFPPEEQLALCSRFGFRVDRLEQAYCDQIPPSELSPKLTVAIEDDLPVLTGYVLIRD